ncbi:MAG: hypothetical protein LRS48_02705 [Desulfurococcales archaeon]|nr:hypothetical protein [Desulfurococcales archaeon]
MSDTGEKGTSTVLDILRRNDITTSIKALLETMLGQTLTPELEKARGERAAEAIKMLAENITRLAPYYAPFAFVSQVLVRLSSRVTDEDDILYGIPLGRLMKCLVDALAAYYRDFRESIRGRCASMGVDSVLAYAYGMITRDCLDAIGESNSKARIILFGPGWRNLLSWLAERGRIAVYIPTFYAYQAALKVDAIIFQAETVGLDAILSRPGPLQVLALPGLSVEAHAYTLSYAYTPLLLASRIGYSNLPSTPIAQPWGDTVQAPLFEIIPYKRVETPIRIVDENREVKPRLVAVRRRVMETITGLIKLVEARCRLYEV